MTRVKKAVHALKNRRNTLRQTKGFRFRRSTNERAANEALAHAGAYSFAHRRDKKGDFRRLWNVRINAGLRPLGFSYSKFIGVHEKGLTHLISLSFWERPMQTISSLSLPPDQYASCMNAAS